ncbi:unnamed protein product [Cyclocybe aegerita]|uniref:DNA polymerase V n=1 Tax=Cyclocybe aegerita TaxID=1973307 RepID=A0A8S0VWR6_CYCAE|nr:unnamed protein product [Cyclocybe aegerita]
MSTTLPLFWHLSASSKKERIDASIKLIGALEQFQAQKAALVPAPTAASGSDEEEEEEEEVIATNAKSDGLDILNAQDVSYSIRRLIRGLASPRESSRLGFAVALTELLSRIDTVTSAQILSVLMDSTKHQGSMSGQEERDAFFARLFGIMSIIQSGLVVRTTALPNSGSSSAVASSLESYEQIINELVNLGDKKSWLRESAWFAISMLVDTLFESDIPWKNEAISKTLDTLFVKATLWSTEKVALALKLQDQYPKRDWKVLLSPHFKNPDLLASGNLSALARILKESTTDEDGVKDPTKAPSGTWKPQLNFAWDIILNEVLPGPNSVKPAKGSFQDFFRVVVDESLFSSTSSPQRKYWGFQVFQKALNRVNEASMPTLFTKNFMRSWINHLSKKDRYLHKVALQTATEVEEFVKDKPQLGFALILQLTGPSGSQQFDRITKTKTVESILGSLDANGIQCYIDYLLSQVDDVNSDAEHVSAINARRTWIIDQLGALIRNHKIPKEDRWIKSILDWLTVHGLFVIKKKSSKSTIIPLRSIPSPVFSDEHRRNCRNWLLLCLGELSAQTTVLKQDDKTAKATAVATDGEFWIAKVVSTIQQLEDDQKHVSTLFEVDEEIAALRTKASGITDKLGKISGDLQESAKGAQLLLLGTLLQQYCEGDDEDNVDSAALQACIDGSSRLLLTDDKKKEDKKTDPGEDEELEPVDLLVDAIIGFLEKSTSYMRTVGNQVFSLLSGSVKESTVDLIVTQLEVRDPSQPEDEDEDMEDLDEDGGDNGEDDGSDSDEESEAGDGDDSGNDSNEDEADLELRSRIEEALRVNGIKPATGETDSEEELMDDDQMMAIDEQLAQVFRSRASEKKTGKNIDAQREATHFKNRILDLVDAYLHKQPSNPLSLRFISPLIELVTGSSQDERQLADKAKGILRTRVAKAKEVPTSADREQAVQIITNIHTRARKTHSPDLLSILSLGSIYLSKVLVHLKGDDLVVDVYRQSLTDFATRKNSALSPHFFQDFIRRFPAQAWCLRSDLLDLARKSINAYRRTQVLQFFELLISSLPSMPTTNDEAVAFMLQLRQLLLELAEDSCGEKDNLSTPQMKELLKLALLAVRQTKRISPATQTIWEPNAWKLLQSKLRKSSRFKASTSLHNMCEQIALLPEGSEKDASKKQSQAPTAKRKADEINGDDHKRTVDGVKNTKRKKVKATTVEES